MKVLLLMVGWVSAAEPGDVPVLPPGEPPTATLQAALASASLPLPDRIAAVSATLLGAPYVVDPEGEGEGHDPDPPGRFDAFDCLTFVEEVLALALALDPVDAPRIRASLRYGDAPHDHAHRRHFMEAEWLPGVQADGWLRDVTASYGTTTLQEREIHVEDWASWPDRAAFPHPDARLPVGPLSVRLLPLAEARAAASRFAPGSVLVIVRADRADRPFWVTHLGFVLDVQGRRVLRHASQMQSSRRVTDSGLAWYLDHLATYRSWPVAGVLVLEPVEPLPRDLVFDAP